MFANHPVHNQVSSLGMKKYYHLSKARPALSEGRDANGISIQNKRHHAPAASMEAKWHSPGEHLAHKIHQYVARKHQLIGLNAIGFVLKCGGCSA